MIRKQLIVLYYSQLAKYSKHIRDGYLFSDASTRFSDDIHKFLEDFQFSQDNFFYFSQLLHQNCIIDKLFDFIKKSINKFCVLLQFIDLQKLYEDRLIEMCDIYSKSDETSWLNFNCMGCNLNTIREMIEQLKKSTEMNEEQNKNMKEFQVKNCITSKSIH